MLRIQIALSPLLRIVKVRATRVAFWPGISTAAMLSSEPEPCGLARWKNEIPATTTSTPRRVIKTVAAGGRLRLAVPNSSAMLMVGPDGIFWGGVLAAEAGESALGTTTGGLGVSSGMGFPRAC